MRTLFIALFLGISCLLSACNLQTNRNQVQQKKGAIIFKLDSAEVYKNPEVSYLEVSELDKFPVEFKEAIQVEPRAKIYRNLGSSYLEQGKVDEAIVAFKKAVQIDANFVEVYYLLADVYSIKGEGVLSRKSLDQAMALEGSYIIDTVRPNGKTPEYSIIELLPPAVLQEFTNPTKPTNPPDFSQGPIKTGVPGK